jgi:hypothetical protein
MAGKEQTMSVIEVTIFYLAVCSPLWAPFLWWEIRSELHRRACARAWDDLSERHRCEAAKRRRDGAE